MRLHENKAPVMDPRVIFRFVPKKERAALKALVQKSGKNLSSLFFVVMYSIGSIQNKYLERKDAKKANGDYGRRWRKNLDHLIGAMQDDFLKDNMLFVHVNPTKLDAMVARCSTDALQPRLRGFQKNFQFDKLFKAFDPLMYREAEVLLFCGKNVLVVSVVHFAETSVSGGSAQELMLCNMAGIPIYFAGSEGVLERYRSRSVVTSIIANGKRVVRGRNIFYTMEDALEALRRDLPRLRSHAPSAPLGELFAAYWMKNTAKKRLKKDE